MSESIFVGKDTDGQPQELLLKMANRHGLIAGATGTGKTVTLQILTEGFSKAGVPVFAADVKGDLSGLSQSGSETHKLHDKLMARARKIGLIGEDYATMLGGGYQYAAMPTVFWDFLGKQGHPVRTTITEMGPTLLARLMQLNETQEGILNIAFALADDEDMLLLDMKDLRAILNFISDNKDAVSRKYGNVTSQSIAAIQREMLVLKRSGGEQYFGEPALKLSDLMRVDENGHGIVSLLAADDLINIPSVYPTFLLWLLSELFEELPEVGNPDKPKMIFFFDEAHLLFDDAPKALINKIEQVSRLIRSKGVGVYFVTQNPADIPDTVLGQLGNRIQHALRAYTPKEQKSIRAAADSFRENPAFDTEEVITDLGVGEALVSLLDKKGVPGIVGRTLIRPPASRLGPATKAERKTIMDGSPVKGVYDQTIDRESAYEVLEAKTAEKLKEVEEATKEATKPKKKPATKKKKSTSTRRSSSRRKKSTGDHILHEVKLIGRQLVRSEGRRILRGILGSMTRR